MKLNGVRFKWKESNPGNDRHYLGFLAQDVLDIMPEPVLYDELNDIYSMEYNALIPVLVEAIKEQQAIIENQQLIIEGLEQKIESVARENALPGYSLNELEQLKAEFELLKSIVQANMDE